MRPPVDSGPAPDRWFQQPAFPATIRKVRRLAAVESSDVFRHPFQPMKPIDRRGWLLALIVAATGCSTAKKKPARTTKKAGSTSRAPSEKNAAAWNRKHRPQGPQTFSNLLDADTWITDLDSKSPQTRITAAKQLGNMGKSAQAALPKLEKAAKDPNAEVAAAAKQAIKAIRQ